MVLNFSRLPLLQEMGSVISVACYFFAFFFFKAQVAFDSTKLKRLNNTKGFSVRALTFEGMCLCSHGESADLCFLKLRSYQWDRMVTCARLPLLIPDGTSQASQLHVNPPNLALYPHPQNIYYEKKWR